MKKLLLVAALIAALIIPCFTQAAELNNVTAEGQDGNLVFKDINGNIICKWDPANRKFVIPSGSVIDVESGGYFKIAGTSVTATAAQLNYLSGATGTTGTGKVVMDTSPTIKGAILDTSANLSYAGASRVVFTNSSKDVSTNANIAWDGSTFQVVGDVSGSTVHGSTITASGDVSGNSVHGSSITASGAIAGASVTATGDVSGNTVHGSTITASGDVSGNSVHGSTGTFSNLTANRVAKTTTGGQLTPSTVTDASFEAVVAPILADASGTGGTTLTETMFQSSHCQFTNYGQGAADASTNLPLAIANLACQGTVVTAQANKWGVQDTTCTMTLIDASGATQAGPYCYVTYDNAVAGQSFDVWTQKYDATTYRWFIKPRVVGTGRTFTGAP